MNASDLDESLLYFLLVVKRYDPAEGAQSTNKETLFLGYLFLDPSLMMKGRESFPCSTRRTHTMRDISNVQFIVYILVLVFFVDFRYHQVIKCMTPYKCLGNSSDLWQEYQYFL